MQRSRTFTFNIIFIVFIANLKYSTKFERVQKFTVYVATNAHVRCDVAAIIFVIYLFYIDILIGNLIPIVGFACQQENWQCCQLGALAIFLSLTALPALQ